MYITPTQFWNIINLTIKNTSSVNNINNNLITVYIKLI